MFRRVLIDHDYGCLDGLANVGLVLDCGANVGYSAAYFLTRHPGSAVVAVEPDPANFAILQRNLAAYGPRARATHAAVWSHDCRLQVSQEPYRDGRDWSRQVRPSETAAPGGGVTGVSMQSLLEVSGDERISILKMDIEGAEAVVFAAHDLWWLDRVDAIAIELHDDSVFGNATAAFYSAIAGRGFQVSRSGELTVCVR